MTPYGESRYAATVIPIRELDDSIVMYIVPRYEYGETLEQALERAKRIAEWLTNHGTMRGKRD